MEHRREKKSVAALKRAMLAWMAEKPVEQITVKELCQAAGVNRSTFYNNYTDLTQLVRALQWDAFGAMSRHLTADSRFARLHVPQRSREALVAIAEYLKTNRAQFLLLLTNSGEEYLVENMVEYYVGFYGLDQAPAEERYAFVYRAMGSFSLLCTWLREGCTLPVEQVAQIVTRLSYGSARG